MFLFKSVHCADTSMQPNEDHENVYQKLKIQIDNCAIVNTSDYTDLTEKSTSEEFIVQF